MLRRVIANASSAPMRGRMSSTVAANTIRLTFVDSEGNRAVVPARIGQTLLEAATQNRVDLEGPCDGGGSPMSIRRTKDWEEIVYGEGPSCFFCHVQIPSRYNKILPEQSLQEREGIENIWEEEYTPTSRLACQIELNRDHDGMIILVPDAPIIDVI
jgi:ferredoxin